MDDPTLENATVVEGISTLLQPELATQVLSLAHLDIDQLSQLMHTVGVITAARLDCHPRDLHHGLADVFRLNLTDELWETVKEQTLQLLATIPPGARAVAVGVVGDTGDGPTEADKHTTL